MQERLVDAGIECAGTLRPPSKEDSETLMGEPVARELTCDSGDGTITISEWTSANKRGMTMTMAGAMVCGFGMVDFSFVQDGNWAVSASDANKDIDTAMIERIGKALGVKPTVINCEDE